MPNGVDVTFFTEVEYFEVILDTGAGPGQKGRLKLNFTEIEKDWVEDRILCPGFIQRQLGQSHSKGPPHGGRHSIQLLSIAN